MFSLIANLTFWRPTWGGFVMNIPSNFSACNLPVTNWDQLKKPPDKKTIKKWYRSKMITQGFYARLTAYTRTMNVPSDHWQDQVPGVIRPKQGKFKTIRTRKSRDNQSTIRKTIWRESPRFRKRLRIIEDPPREKKRSMNDSTKQDNFKTTI